MDAPRGLSAGDALHPMDTAFELKPAKRAMPGDCGYYLLDTSETGGAQAQGLHLPSMALGITRVHPEQLAREQRSLFAASPCTNFQQDVLFVIRVARRKEEIGRASCRERV